jgi:hypothetical protein
MDSAYVRDHLATIHSYDSFGRALTDGILRSVARKLEERGNEPVEEFKVALTATVRPTVLEAKKKCVEICFHQADDPDILWCVHVYYEPIKWWPPWD